MEVTIDIPGAIGALLLILETGGTPDIGVITASMVTNGSVVVGKDNL
jgi:hypothetical protein